jgi:hypothetical protein
MFCRHVMFVKCVIEILQVTKCYMLAILDLHSGLMYDVSQLGTVLMWTCRDV